MLDRTATRRPDRSLAAAPAFAASGRRRALAACAALVLALHVLFIGGAGGLVPGSAPETVLASVSVRTLPVQDAAVPVAVVADPPPVTAALPPALEPPKPRPLRRSREPALPASQAPMVQEKEASANSEERRWPSPAVDALPTSVTEAATAPHVVPAASAPPEPGDTSEAAATAAGASAPLLAAGEQPPPLYRTQLPASATLHYQVRRGFLRGTGEIRWQASGDRYRLVLESRIAGLTLLIQTSEGAIDSNGLAPVRFLDQRARRSAQAANFRRDDARITFSGSGAEWPLLAGSQDRLSWMIQLAGIASAEPERLVDGGRIVMVVVGARGDAAVWTLRYAGRDDVATTAGTVHAVKFVRDPRSAYDTSAEIWLDPERSYLPAHATLRNSSGVSEYDLLLERVDPTP
ncbi:MAG: DUF3108 domain-containing protein [Caldimonas sp.]